MGYSISRATVANVFAGLLALASALLPAATLAEPPTFTIGIVPQQAPSKLLRDWEPLLSFLEQRTGYRFRFRTAPTIPSFEDRLAAGEYDFAYMNPYHFTVFNRDGDGYRAVVKAKGKQVRGILVVRDDSPIRTLAELGNATLAFPAPAAFAASVLPRAHLMSEGISFDVQYVSSHDSVYQAVAAGLFPAGGGVVRTFEATDPRVRQQLRVLWSTPGYTPHAFAAHARVAGPALGKVRQALVEMDADENGREALERLKINGFEAAEDTDWDDVRALEIDTRLGGS